MSEITSIRPFIGAKNYNVSRAFYKKFGFEEYVTSPKMSYFSKKEFGFYLQDYFVEDWVNNSMIFLEVKDVQKEHDRISALNLKNQFPASKLKPIVTTDWGREFFLHDPSNILWHIGSFNP